MLQFEREVVGVLIESPDQPLRSSVEAFVDGSLKDMPEPIRAGVVAESILLGGYAAALRKLGRIRGDRGLVERLDAWETSPVGVVRQYVRMMRSLVLFAENELASEGAA
ncbi:MAG TPA: hypothetical protein VK306_11095 [Acidimicrobiales bacterium]|nr:hypothetical protein [Acidimicrobiales bacterium]